MKNFINLLLYFILAVIFFGGSGVWMPYVLNIISGRINVPDSNYQNFSTYFIAIIAAGCIDLILITINGSQKNKIGLVLLILIILFGALVFVGIDFYWILNGEFERAKYALVIGLLLAFSLWWISNWRRKHINPYDALGGPVK